MKKLGTLMSIFSIQQLSATPSAKPINTNRKEIPVISQSQVVQGSSSTEKMSKEGRAIVQHVQLLMDRVNAGEKIDTELEWARLQCLIIFDAMIVRDLEKPIDRMTGAKMLCDAVLSLRFSKSNDYHMLHMFYMEEKEKASSSTAASPTRYQLKRSADKKLSAKPDDDSKTKRKKENDDSTPQEPKKEENDDSTPQETNKNTLFLNRYHSAGCWPIDL